jgi:hypothetical protein
MPSPMQSELSGDSLPANLLGEVPTVRPANGLSSVGKRALIALVRFLIIFCIGVSATLAWQSHDDPVREMIASSYPQLSWLVPQADVIGLASRTASSPDQKQPSAISLDLDALQQDIDRIATSIASSQDEMRIRADQVATRQEQMMRSLDRIATSIASSEEQMKIRADQIATSQEQTTRGLDQFTADQKQMMREITKLQEIEQPNSSRNSEPSLLSASAPKPTSRPASAPKPMSRPTSTPAAKPSRASQEPTVP